MADIDLNAMTISELKSLRNKVVKAIDTFEDRRKKEATAVLEAKAKEMGFSLADLLASTKAAKPPLPPKYQHPKDSSLTWSGRGRKPRWINDAVSSGADLDSFLIA